MSRSGRRLLANAKVGARRSEGEIPTIFVVFSLCWFLLVGAIHLTFVYHGQAAVNAAAQDAFAAAQVEGGSRSNANDAANRTLDLAPFLTDRKVKIYSNDQEIQVYVSAEISLSFFSVNKTVWARAGGSQERFFNEEERDEVGS